MLPVLLNHLIRITLHHIVRVALHTLHKLDLAGDVGLLDGNDAVVGGPAAPLACEAGDVVVEVLVELALVGDGDEQEGFLFVAVAAVLGVAALPEGFGVVFAH